MDMRSGVMIAIHPMLADEGLDHDEVPAHHAREEQPGDDDIEVLIHRCGEAFKDYLRCALSGKGEKQAGAKLRAHEKRLAAAVHGDHGDDDDGGE